MYKEIPSNSKECIGILHKDCSKYHNSNTTSEASEKNLQTKWFDFKLGQKMSRYDN